MSQSVWTEIEWRVLAPGERAPNAPADTADTPYLARVRGMATDPVVGKDCDVVTASGRTLRGTVVDTHPGYQHSFGRPLPEWVQMREAIQLLLRGDKA